MPDEMMNIDDAIAKATTEVEAGDSGATENGQQQEVQAQPEQQEQAQAQTEGKERDESGKFKGKEAQPQVSPEAKPGEAKEVKDLTFDAPASWRKEAKEQFAALPLPVKAEIAKRERESLAALNEANNKLASREKEGGDLEKVVAPFAQDWGAKGIRTSEAIAQTLSRAKYAYANPEKFIREFAAETGVNLNLSQTGQDDGTYQDPELAALKTEISGLKQTLTTYQQGQVNNAQQQQAAAVNAFADAKGEDGQPLRPHFDKVRDLMVNLMPRLNATEPGLSPAEKLGKAYDMACRAHPEIWQEMREDMFVKSQSTQVQQQAAAAQAAKAHAISPSSSPLGGSGGDVSMRGKSLDDVISHVMTQGQGRV